MTNAVTGDISVPADAPQPSPPTRRTPRNREGWFAQLLMRLHFYAGIFIGPFILIAAASGALYAFTPQLERLVYADVLTAPVTETSLSLSEQVTIANEFVGSDAVIAAVRPAPEPGDTTRVMYADPELGASETRAIFIDPGTGEVHGDFTVYGTSGQLPLRTWIDQLHRSLHLGDAGRLYSELAASWLGVIALAGIVLWVMRYRKARSAKQKKNLLRPDLRAKGFARTRSLHTSAGVWVLLVALFLSATGITWSQYGGANFSALRSAVGWETPALNTALGAAASESDEHAGHDGHDAHAGHDGHDAHAGHDGHDGHDHGHAEGEAAGDLDSSLFDEVLAIAQDVNVNTGLVEIRPPGDSDTAWVVQEIQRSFPTEVDSVAIDPGTLEVVDRVDFAEFSFIAKLSRWGIDLHMGTMFGLPNQIVLFVMATAIAAMVVWGYVMWWQRRPTRDPARKVGAPPTRGAITRAPWWGIAAVLAAAAAIGIFLPLMGISLAAFLLVDVVVGIMRRRSQRSSRNSAPEVSS
ncbi:PepSY-associated TM helix domain-containing protein [Humidisolicoccus flavus]|uniref:PepSY-associated TM helix domain-containing protein n=1 Tax=Humidisolicoccus flavus TaxID=3111414 RepID=UPI00324AB2F9